MSRWTDEHTIREMYQAEKNKSRPQQGTFGMSGRGLRVDKVADVSAECPWRARGACDGRSSSDLGGRSG